MLTSNARGNDLRLSKSIFVRANLKASFGSPVQAISGRRTTRSCWEYERKAAADAVRHLTGVSGISNEIILKPTVQPTAVKDAMEKALKRNAEIDARNVKVTTDGSKVTLSGRVRSWAEKDAAGRAASSTPGVLCVQNDITLSFG